MSRGRWLVGMAAAFAMAVVAVAAPGRSPAGACEGPVQDPVDPRSLQHVLPGAPPPTYATEPPTSGPHQAGRLEGVLAQPVPGPVQVGALEAGQVLLQHRDLGSDDRAALESLAGPLVVVAPNDALPAHVVASAWRTRQLCRDVDLESLRRFVDAHAGQGPAHG